MRSSFVNNLMSFFPLKRIFFPSFLHFSFFLFISRGVKNVIYGSALHLLNELTAVIVIDDDACLKKKMEVRMKGINNSNNIHKS